MAKKTGEQIEDWLKKLERESWQLELLVSAFTIFLLIGAISQFDEFIIDLQYKFNFNKNGLFIGMIFLIMLEYSLRALTIFLIAHLLLRGFWIGTIGLRSVQNRVDFEKLNYSDFFTEKLKKKVITLDQLVIRLDEICSVIFSFAFLVMFTLLAFGLFMGLAGIVGFIVSTLGDITPESWDPVIATLAVILFLTLFVTGLIYLLDYFTLGFFKKFRWFSKVYYPFYWFYSYVTLAILSRSIYYYMIGKFSKKRIRLLFGLSILLILGAGFFKYDHYPYFPEESDENFILSRSYDDLRQQDKHINNVSIPSQFISGAFLKVFIRYNPKDNKLIEGECPDFTPPKEEGLNYRYRLEAKDGNLNIDSSTSGDSQKMLQCISSIYQISINDSVYADLKFYFYKHPTKEQLGLQSVISTDSFNEGENILNVLKVNRSDSIAKYNTIVSIPFWYSH